MEKRAEETTKHKCMLAMGRKLKPRGDRMSYIYSKLVREAMANVLWPYD